MKRRTVVILRSDAADRAYDADIREVGFEPLTEQILTVKETGAPIPPDDTGRPLVFTSAHAVRLYAAQTQRRDNIVFTVGDTTAETARDAGFGAIENAGRTGDDLADLILKTLKSSMGVPLYVRGENISVDLRGILAEKSTFMDEFIIYKALSAENLSLDLLKRLDKREVEAVMFFSKRGAVAFSNLIEQYGRAPSLRATKALCISDGVLQSVSVLLFQQAVAAKTPDRDGMLELLKNISVT